MSSDDQLRRGPTSSAHDVFQVVFQGADTLSSFWQPMFKGFGRWQMEMAQLSAKQTRASIELGQKIARAPYPGTVMEAYRAYWTEVGGIYADANRNISMALVRAAPHAAVLELPLKPKVRPRDTLQLIEEADAPTAQQQAMRKVA